MYRGQHVRKKGDASVIGFCTDEDPGTGECVVEVMFAPGSMREDRVHASQLESVRLLPNMRAWVRHEERWLPGRLGKADTDGTHEWIGSERALYARLGDIRVRPEAVEFDPRAILQRWAQEGMYLFNARDAMVREILEQESYAHGMTGLLSSGVDLYEHQIHNVFRVLMDPVQRYMLGDEVGLGKTIQAGILIRQWMLDEQAAFGEGQVRRKVLVTAPEMIVRQWSQELRGRFRLDDFRLDDAEPCWRVVSHELLVEMLLEEGGPAWDWTDLVVDEVQHLATWVCSDDRLRRAFNALRGKATQAQGVLLLSATPPYGDHEACLALLQLLDPHVYESTSRDEFRLRLDLRQKVSAALPFLKPGQSAAMVRLKLKGLEEALGSSLPGLQPVLLRAREAAAVGKGTEDLTPALEDLRIYLREVVRIHNRFIRSRRDQIGELLEYRATEESDQSDYDPLPDLAELGLADDLMEEAAGYLEAWRAGRYAQVEGDEVAECRSAWIHEALWVALSAGEPVLRAALDVWGDSTKSAPELEALLGAEAVRKLKEDDLAFNEEYAIRDLRRMAEGDGILKSKLGALESWLQRNHRTQKRVVIFASGPGMADAVRAHVSTLILVGCEVFSLRVDASRSEKSTARRSFRDAKGSAILICDSAGEEGVNLQFADTLMHMDVPLSTNRLEQRIGRLDRIGQSSKIIQKVVMAAGEGALDAQRVALMCQAYGVFVRSISGLQAAVDEQANRLRLVALRRGYQQLAEAAIGAREQIDIERSRVAVEQEAEVADAEEVGASLSVKAMRKDETRGEDVRVALDGWAIGCYKLERAIGEAFGDGAYALPRDLRRTLLDPKQQSQVLRFLGDAGTFRRQRASDRPKDYRLRRMGDGLFDAFARMARFEDRGKCFAIWRQVRDWKSDMEWAGFRFDVLVRVPEVATEVLWQEGLEDAGGLGSSQGLLRRLRSYLPTFRETVWVRRDGKVESDGRLIDLLTKPAKDSLACPVKDTNLHKGRWKAALQDRLDLEKWPEIVDRCADAALVAVAGHPDFAEYCNGAADAFERDSRKREAVLDLRVRLMGEGNSGLLAQDLRRERATREVFAACLRSPEVRLDAGGFVFASGQACPLVYI